MNKHQKILIEKQLEKINSRHKKIAFWGASTFLLEFLQQSSIEKYNIIGIIDSNEKINGSVLLNKKIYTPNCIPTIPDYVIFTIENKNAKFHKTAEEWISKNWPNTKLLPNIFIQDDIEALASNKLYLINNNERIPVVQIPGLNISWRGTNSIVEIEANPIPRFKNCNIVCTNNSHIKISNSVYKIINLEISLEENNCNLSIGKNFQMQGGKIWMTGESNLSIEIGEDCMFSHGIIIRSSDYHPVYSTDTKKIINYSKGVKIGNHVWICQNTTILKNTTIPNNCIIGANSLVNKAFAEENSVISGNPAKITKKDVSWHRESIGTFIN